MKEVKPKFVRTSNLTEVHDANLELAKDFIDSIEMKENEAIKKNIKSTHLALNKFIDQDYGGKILNEADINTIATNIAARDFLLFALMNDKKDHALDKINLLFERLTNSKMRGSEII